MLRLWAVIVRLPLDLALLSLAAPVILFPARFPAPLTWVALGLVVASWPARRIQTGRWHLSTAADWPILLLLAMLPVAIWAAPPPLRAVYSWPRGFILVWNLALFFAVAAYAGRSRLQFGWALGGVIAATQTIAILAPFGIERRAKIAVLGKILAVIPDFLVGVFAGAEGGFSTNQLAGVLLYLLPLLIALTVAGVWRGGRRDWQWWAIAACTLWMLAVMALAQSRGGLLGLAAGLFVVVLLQWRAGWGILVGLALLVPLGVRWLPSSVLDALSDAATVRAVGGLQTLTNFRPDVWRAARWGIADFPFTGMGLGTFREIGPLLYPMSSVPDNFDLAHAHNFFLQTGLDVGLPGLAAVVALHLLACWELYRLWRTPGRVAPAWPAFLTWRALSVGWMGSIVAHTVYSQFDAVALGSKPGFLLWLLFALIFAAGRLSRTPG